MGSAGSIACANISMPVASLSLPASSHPPVIAKPGPSYHCALHLGGMTGAAILVAGAAVAEATTAMPAAPASATTGAPNPADQTILAELAEFTEQLLPPQEQPPNLQSDFCGMGPPSNGHGQEMPPRTAEQDSLAAVALPLGEFLQQQPQHHQPEEGSGSGDCVPSMHDNPLETDAVVLADVQSCIRDHSCQATSVSSSQWHGSNPVPVHVEMEASASSSLLRSPSTTMPVQVEVEVLCRTSSQSLSGDQQQLQGLVPATRRKEPNQAAQSMPQSEQLKVQPPHILWSAASDDHSKNACGPAVPRHVAAAPTPSRAVARTSQAVDPKLWPRPVLQAPSLMGHLRLPALRRANGQ